MRIDQETSITHYHSSPLKSTALLEQLVQNPKSLNSPAQLITLTMATSSWPTTNYASSSLTESAGAVLFDLAFGRICLLEYPTSKPGSSTPRIEYLLAKGRRNWSETRADAAMREVGEETGYACELLDASMETRCPPSVEEDGNTPDEVRTARGRGEPFMLQVREVGEARIKLIWWFVAGSLREGGHEGASHSPKNTGTELRDGMGVYGMGETQFKPVWFRYEEAVERLTFEDDREVVRKAIEIVAANFDEGGERRV